MDWWAHAINYLGRLWSLNSLELNIRQLVLTDIATNIGKCRHDSSTDDLEPTIELITSKVETRDVSSEASQEMDERMFMASGSRLKVWFSDRHDYLQSTSRIQCNIGFAELAVSLPDGYIETTIPVLLDILRDIPHIDFDQCMAWDGEEL
jgi:phosphatidylinositol 4-kinase